MLRVGETFFFRSILFLRSVTLILLPDSVYLECLFPLSFPFFPPTLFSNLTVCSSYSYSKSRAWMRDQSCLQLVVVICPILPGTILVCACPIVINNAPLYSQNCSSLNNKLYSHPTYSKVLIFFSHFKSYLQST